MSAFLQERQTVIQIFLFSLSIFFYKRFFLLNFPPHLNKTYAGTSWEWKGLGGGDRPGPQGDPQGHQGATPDWTGAWKCEDIVSGYGKWNSQEMASSCKLSVSWHKLSLRIWKRNPVTGWLTKQKWTHWSIRYRFNHNCLFTCLCTCLCICLCICPDYSMRIPIWICAPLCWQWNSFDALVPYNNVKKHVSVKLGAKKLSAVMICK